MEIALIYFAVLALAFFLLIVRPQRRRAAMHRQFVSTLSVGDEVMTSGGVFGTIRGLATTRSSSRSPRAPCIRVARPAIAQPAVTNVPGRRPTPSKRGARPTPNRRRTKPGIEPCVGT